MLLKAFRLSCTGELENVEGDFTNLNVAHIAIVSVRTVHKMHFLWFLYCFFGRSFVLSLYSYYSEKEGGGGLFSSCETFSVNF